MGVPCTQMEKKKTEQQETLKACTLHGKKENNSAEKEGFLSFSLFLFPLARNNENGNKERRILIGCAPFTVIPVYTLPAARKRFL